MPDVTENRRAARERYDDIAKQIEREDGLVNVRTTWLLLSETLLLGGVGYLATKAADKDVLENHPGVATLLLLGGAALLALGAYVAAKCRDALVAAHVQLMYLRECWDNSLFLKQEYVPPFGDISQHTHGINYPVKLARSLFWFSWVGAGIFALLALWLLHGQCPCIDVCLYCIAAAYVLVIGILVGLYRLSSSPPLSSAHWLPAILEVDCERCVRILTKREGDKPGHAVYCRYYKFGGDPVVSALATERERACPPNWPRVWPP
jgi:hypothetical protein